MDVRQMVDFHRSRDAGVTVSALAVPLDKARGFGVLGADAEGRVCDFQEKPKQPPAIPGNPRLAYASMGNYLFDPRVLERVLVEARSRGEVDFGRDLLPRICKGLRVYAYDYVQNLLPAVHDCDGRSHSR